MNRNLGLGKKIKIMRLAKRMDQDELAERVGVSYQTVSSWENGHSVPRDKNLEKIKVELGWPPDDQAEVAFGILAGDERSASDV